MLSALFIAAAAALLAVVGAAMHTVLAERAAHRERVWARLEMVASAGSLAAPKQAAPRRAGSQWLEARLWRAGIQLTRWHVIGAIFVAVLVPGIVLIARGPVAAVLSLGLLVAGAAGYVSFRTRQRRERVLEQLPGFLDHVVRAVHTGSSLPNALLAATTETTDPIRGLFERVVRQTRLGVALEEALEQAADLYGLRELRILSLTVRVSQQYGGSVREILASIVAMIRQRERMRREFLAMTGETRLSAVILGGLPALIALYVVVVNPDYIGRMWIDSAGRIALFVAGGLQAMGCMVLWRMVRAV